ncbi:MAG TPA: threonylcarbamoyl-AMP synthase [Rhodospirillaceae bacterium]|nr:threonylcarbamoyl-AMP synthase [Rhodospirillaceae bacterium]|tara:strand:+ start:4116 stop:5120 length:1005 start_codon:yes stop_codon:yes gene_type:complete
MGSGASAAGSAIHLADDAGIARAARALQSGKLVAFPTETVYGLGADATNDTAVAEIYAVKGRPDFNPLIVHIPDADAATTYAEITPLGRLLMERFWPGPLSIVLPRRADCTLSRLVSAGLDTVALRAPAHDVGQALLKASHLPVAAPSANRSGRMSPTQAAHVATSLPGPDHGGPAVILDAGACAVGLESTVVDATGDQAVILRPGGLSREDIETALGGAYGPVAEAHEIGPGGPRSPGMLARHYAPGKPLRLNAAAAENGEALLGFGPDVPAEALNLSATGDTTEAAANLFAYLHDLDAGPTPAIAVMPIPDRGLGRAINDRLIRAARTDDSE